MFRFLFNSVIRGLSLFFFMLAASNPLHAQTEDTAPQKKLLEFLNQVELPYSKQSFSLVLLQLRESAPELFLQGVGRGAKLGTAWAAGNPYWEQSYTTIENAISAYEKQNGPIFLISTKDFAQQFSPPWSEADLDFLLQFIQTPAGKTMLSVLDTTTTGNISKNILSGKELHFSEKNLQALHTLDQQARLKFSEAMLAVTNFNPQQKETYQRADELIGKIAKMDVFTIGQKIMQQSLLRFFQVAYGILPDINRSIEGFRLGNAHEAAVPAPAPTPAPASKTP